jgi:hypothetical protein
MESASTGSTGTRQELDRLDKARQARPRRRPRQRLDGASTKPRQLDSSTARAQHLRAAPADVRGPRSRRSYKRGQRVRPPRRQRGGLPVPRSSGRAPAAAAAGGARRPAANGRLTGRRCGLGSTALDASLTTRLTLSFTATSHAYMYRRGARRTQPNTYSEYMYHTANTQYLYS